MAAGCALRDAVHGRAAEDHCQSKDRGHLIAEAKRVENCADAASGLGLFKRFADCLSVCLSVCLSACVYNFLCFVPPSSFPRSLSLSLMHFFQLLFMFLSMFFFMFRSMYFDIYVAHQNCIMLQICFTWQHFSHFCIF